MIRISSLIFLIFFSFTAFGQTEIPAPDVSCETFLCFFNEQFPDISAWIVALFMFFSAVLRATVELLTFIGKTLQHQKVSALAEKLGSALVWASQIIGWFGAGTPTATKDKQQVKQKS